MSPEGRGLAWRRVPLLMLGGVALVTGLWAGLTRLGALPGPLPVLAHGPLMVSGFLGTVISLERAVAARAWWAFAGPLLCGAGALATLLGHAAPGAVLLTAGSLVVVVVLARVAWSAPELHHLVLVLAAVAWLAGNALLALGRPVFEVVPAWMVFLVGTIAAERLELTRVLPRSRRALALFCVAFALFVAGAVLSTTSAARGFEVLSAGALGLAAWLLRFDVARRTVKQHELTRFIAVALLSGYGWLALAGGLGLWFDFQPAGPSYDAVLHAVFVGFVFSMIFGHAPIILPAVLGVKVAYAPRFYAHLALLHGSMVMRVAGDLAGGHEIRVLGAWGNAAAIVLFVGSTFVAVRAAGKKPLGPALAPLAQ